MPLVKHQWKAQLLNVAVVFAQNVTTKPDLMPTEITYPGSIKAGDSVLFDSGIKNIGNKDSSGFNIKWFLDGV